MAVQVSCSNSSKRHTYWNFTLPDQMMLDFWNAVNGDESEPIPNFSTPPTWLYSPSDYVYCDDPAVVCPGYEKGTAPVADLDALGAYYGRLVAWYTQGGFSDEYGNWVGPGHKLNITLWEIFNEVDAEHGHDVVSYTQEFDAIVAGIRKFADPEHKIRFVGLSLPNIDDKTKVVEWVTYFLNASNHREEARDALHFIGYHAYPTNGPYSPDPTSFEKMFSYADTFMDKVVAVEQVRRVLSPSTRTMLDETGTDMDAVLQGGPPSSTPLYWVASASYFAYLYARVAALGDAVVTLGVSQLMDAPGREPSVTMLDWTNGNGTARYWVLKLLQPLVGNTIARLDNQADSATLETVQGLVLIVNKLNKPINVTLSTSTDNVRSATGTLQVVDEESGEGPPLRRAWSGGVVQLAPFATTLIQYSE